MKRIVFALLVYVLLFPSLGYGETIPVSGTVVTPNGTRLNGRVRMTLSNPARDAVDSTIVIPQSVEYRIVNGSVQSGRIVPNSSLQPSGTYYLAEYFSSTGAKVMQNAFRITGSSFVFGQATPTNITTSNISFDEFTGLEQITSKRINNVRSCDQFPGATAGARIVACIADLPATGGIADARGLEGTQTIAVNMFSGVTKPVDLLLGCANFQTSVKQTPGSFVNIQGISLSNGGTWCSKFTATAAITLFEFTNSDGVTVEKIALDGNSVGTIGISVPNTSWIHYSYFNQLYISGFTSRCVDIQGEVFILDFFGGWYKSCGDGFYANRSGAGAIQKMTITGVEIALNTNDNLELIGVEDFNMWGGSLQGAQRGAAINSSTNINFYGVQFEQNTVAEIDYYKTAANSATQSVYVSKVDGSFFYGTNATAVAIRAHGAQNVHMTDNFFPDRYPNGVINFTNSGDTNALNGVNLFDGSNRIGGATNKFLNRDGLNVCLSNACSEDTVSPTTFSGMSVCTGFSTSTGIASGCGAVTYGVYTPTAFNSVNLTTATPNVATYLRVGNSVTVSGTVTFDAILTGNTQTLVELSLPVASSLAASTDLAGTLTSADPSGLQFPGEVLGHVANDRAWVNFYAQQPSAIGWAYTYTYKIQLLLPTLWLFRRRKKIAKEFYEPVFRNGYPDGRVHDYQHRQEPAEHGAAQARPVQDCGSDLRGRSAARGNAAPR